MCLSSLCSHLERSDRQDSLWLGLNPLPSPTSTRCHSRMMPGACRWCKGTRQHRTLLQLQLCCTAAFGNAAPSPLAHRGFGWLWRAVAFSILLLASEMLFRSLQKDLPLKEQEDLEHEFYPVSNSFLQYWIDSSTLSNKVLSSTNSARKAALWMKYVYSAI